jgi:hypothetical protein
MSHAVSRTLHAVPGNRLVSHCAFAGVIAMMSLVAAACGSPAPADPQQAATQFVKAVNTKNLTGMMGQASTPFHFRQQQWGSAAGGAGAVRGATTERVAPTRYELGMLLQDVATVKIAVATPEGNTPSKDDLLRDLLTDAPGVWSGLNLFLFRHDATDPHVAIVGVDAAGKVQAVYVS